MNIKIPTCPYCEEPLDDLVSNLMAHAGTNALPPLVCPECYKVIEGDTLIAAQHAATGMFRQYWNETGSETLRQVLLEIERRCWREAEEYKKAVEMEGYGALVEFTDFILGVRRRFGFAPTAGDVTDAA